ncbi:MAG: tRNA (N6-isopentenyl adenosine(37)-C2)-methylthiotransferase MiaB [Oscillospiraceae bacterium]|nr:tRNA (N6-isopentenyl adenosine(37)-C2)-methylthiotransferase MiaB [Oscillospiraceae bacterium]
MKKPKRIEVAPADVSRQREIAKEIHALHRHRQTPPLALVDTYGCQQNEADSEIIRGYLAEMGYVFTDAERDADVIIINTCAVRESAENRVWGNVGALTHTKRDKPEQLIVLCGCMAQQESVAERVRDSFRHVDLVFGPHALWRLPEFIKQLLTERGRIFEISDTEGTIAEDLPQVRTEGPAAWLSIMYGCDNFCTYCIVPHVRGRERSRAPERILEDAKKLIADGVKDITLLGQNVNAYGQDLDGDMDFAWLLEQLNALPGDFLIRFMTSHPKDATERLFAAMARCDKVAKHIHLPVQAGNSRVLSAMNRGYTKADYLERIATARRYMPEIILTSDIIVGFPGETEAEFTDTLDVLETVQFDALFTFIFSPRSGTPAAEMDDPVSRAEKQVWFDRLLTLQNDISAKRHRAYIGTVQRILIDGKGDDARYGLTGRTEGGRLIRLAGDEALIGQFCQVEITDASTWSLTGKLVG